MNPTPSHLFSPLTLRGVTLRNRIAVSPMCMYSAEERDGRATDWHLVHLGARASGGAGLVIAEATAVEARGRISPQDLGLWDDAQIEPLAHVNRFLRSQGAASAVQLAHAGRKAGTWRPWDRGDRPAPAIPFAEGGWPTVSPSGVPFDAGWPETRELSAAEIGELVRAWGAAARRSLDAGFDVIEVHGAHGYLIHQFLSPFSNRRADAYGGSFENRTRFVREVVSEVRRFWPERLPLFVRLSVTDWAAAGEGWDIEQSVELSRTLKGLGADLIDCSSGGTLPRAPIPVGPGYQTAFAARIRAEAGIATGAVGMITSPHQADHIVRTGQADVVLLARELLRDPHWPSRAARELGQPLPVPPQYERAW